MNLTQIKELINKLEFSPESKEKLNEILDSAINRGNISPDEKERLLGIVDVEIASADIEAETLEEIAMALDNFAGELDNAQDLLTQDLEFTDDALEEDSQASNTQA